jgi:hypothetical protein
MKDFHSTIKFLEDEGYKVEVDIILAYVNQLEQEADTARWNESMRQPIMDEWGNFVGYR